MSSLGFQISEDDIVSVLTAARRWEKTIMPARKERDSPHASRVSIRGACQLSAEDLAVKLRPLLDEDAIETSALAVDVKEGEDDGEVLSRQTDAALEEIERQLDDIDPRILSEGFLPAEADVENQADVTRDLANPFGARQGPLTGLYGAIGSLYDELERAGFAGSPLIRYQALRLRREEALLDRSEQGAQSAALWQELIDVGDGDLEPTSDVERPREGRFGT